MMSRFWSSVTPKAVQPHVAKGEETPASVAAQVATKIAFLIAELGPAAWAPLVPYAKQRLGIDEGGLGLLLLCGGAGSLTAMPLAGTLTTRLGCRRVIGIATLCICASLIGLATASSPILLALALFLCVMVRQHLGLGRLDLREACLDHAGDLGMQLLSTALEQRVIRGSCTSACLKV